MKSHDSEKVQKVLVKSAYYVAEYSASKAVNLNTWKVGILTNYYLS
jgi:hypothetical protein